MGGQSRHRRRRGASHGGNGGRRCRRDPDLQTLETGRPEVCGPRAGKRPATATGTSMAPRGSDAHQADQRVSGRDQAALRECAKLDRERPDARAAAAKQGMGRRGRSLALAHVSARRPCARPPKCRTSRRRRWRTATRHHRVALALEPRGGGRGSATSRMRGGGHSVLSRRASRCGTRAAVHRIAIAPGWQGASVGFRRVIAVGNGCSAARDPRRWGR